MTDKFISIEGITKRFPAPGGGSTTVFEDLWLSMGRGEFSCIIGHSGCGKTTVLNILAGLDAPSAGTVIVDNQAIEGPSLDRAVIFQSHALLPWLTVMGNVVYAVASKWRFMSKENLHAHAQKHGAVYSMAYGDQPAIICELVDWARTCGFEVVAAGKGTKFAPLYRRSTPDTAFGYYGFTPEQIAHGGFNPKMFNSFLDGTKSAIEMVAVANATGLAVSEEGLSFAPASVYDLPVLLRPRHDGGILPQSGMVDVVSCITPDERFVEKLASTT